jgi:CDP-paratose 2-epimerase
MKLLITGICGFVGYSIAEQLRKLAPGFEIFGIDNLNRAGSERNRLRLQQLGVRYFHGDLRSATDVLELPATDFVIDAAANPSVMAGMDGKSSSKQVMEHNLIGTINMLEYCKRHRAGFLLLSTSRVYSIAPLTKLPLKEKSGRYELDAGVVLPGFSDRGVSEMFSTQAPISLYGSTKLASEIIALEYGETFNLPVWINRCGVIAGAGQFGRADQGIFSFWIHSYHAKRPLKYIGFGGHGFQVRDCVHPADIARLVWQQLDKPNTKVTRVQNLSGGVANSMSLFELSCWCEKRFGRHEIGADKTERPFDVPWLVLDSNLAEKQYGWKPSIALSDILDEISRHAESNPNWLDVVS